MGQATKNFDSGTAGAAGVSALVGVVTYITVFLRGRASTKATMVVEGPFGLPHFRKYRATITNLGTRPVHIKSIIAQGEKESYLVYDARDDAESVPLKTNDHRVFPFFQESRGSLPKELIAKTYDRKLIKAKIVPTGEVTWEFFNLVATVLKKTPKLRIICPGFSEYKQGVTCPIRLSMTLESGPSQSRSFVFKPDDPSGHIFPIPDMGVAEFTNALIDALNCLVEVKIERGVGDYLGWTIVKDYLTCRPELLHQLTKKLEDCESPDEMMKILDALRREVTTSPYVHHVWYGPRRMPERVCRREGP